MPMNAQDEGHLLPPLLSLGAMDRRRHHCKISDSKALRPRLYMALVQRSPVVDTGSLESKWFPCLLWMDSSKISMSVSFWHPNLMQSYERNTTSVTRCDPLTMLPSWTKNHPQSFGMTPSAWVSEHLGAFGTCHAWKKGLDSSFKERKTWVYSILPGQDCQSKTVPNTREKENFAMCPSRDQSSHQIRFRLGVLFPYGIGRHHKKQVLFHSHPQSSLR